MGGRSDPKGQDRQAVGENLEQPHISSLVGASSETSYRRDGTEISESYPRRYLEK